MKLTVYHSDPEVLAAMAEMLAREFRPQWLILDPEPAPLSGETPEPVPETSPEGGAA